MNEQTLALLSIDTLAQMNAQFAEAYKTTKNQDARTAAQLVYQVGCKKAGGEKEYRFHFELAYR